MDRLNKKYSHTAVVIAATLSIVAAANAEPIFDYQAIASAANPAPAGSRALGPAGAVGGIGGPVSFTMPYSGMFTLSVGDCCLVGDVYQAFVDGRSLGFTKAVPLYGPQYSTGTFTAFLSAGRHTFDIEDQILSYIGYSDPYGGGTVPTVFSPAGVEVTGQASPAPTPEPGTYSLIGMALVGASLVRKRQLGLK